MGSLDWAREEVRTETAVGRGAPFLFYKTKRPYWINSINNMSDEEYYEEEDEVEEEEEEEDYEEEEEEEAKEDLHEKKSVRSEISQGESDGNFLKARLEAKKGGRVKEAQRKAGQKERGSSRTGKETRPTKEGRGGKDAKGRGREKGQRGRRKKKKA